MFNTLSQVTKTRRKKYQLRLVFRVSNDNSSKNQTNKTSKFVNDKVQVFHRLPNFIKTLENDSLQIFKRFI